MTTAPRKLPSSASFFSAAVIFARRCDDMPTSSGLASGSGVDVCATASAANDNAAANHAAAKGVNQRPANTPQIWGSAYQTK